MACDAENVISSTELSNLKLDIATIDDVVESSLDTTTTKSGKVTNTLVGQLKLLGYQPPVTYAGSIVFTANDNTKTVDESSIIYAPLPSALPFTTSGTFIGDDDARFFVIQGITTTELIGFTDKKHNDVADMIADSDLSIGMIVETLGYGEEGDGGGNNYKIVAAATGTDDGGEFIDLATHQAQGLFPGGNVYVNQFGAVSDLGGADTDNGPACNNAAAYLKNKTSAEGGTLRFGSFGTGYMLSQVSVFSWVGLVIDLNGMPVQLIATGTNNYTFQLTSCIDSRVINGRMIGTSDAVSLYDALNLQAGIGVIAGSGCRVNNIIFEKFISHGVHAENMSPSTTIRGVDVDHCSFLDFPLDATTDKQACINFENGAEYCNTTYNHFQNHVSAQRDVGGANSNFIGNMIMNSSCPLSDTQAAGIYNETDDNFGKYNISFNHFNHNDTGARLITLIGDPANTRNPSYITNNQLLSNGDATGSTLIRLVECNKVQITGNNIRENVAIVSPVNEGLIEAVDSNNIKVTDNFFLGGDYAVNNDNSTLIYGDNIFEDQDSGLERRVNGGTHKLAKNRTYNMQILAAHTVDSTDDSGVTISGVTTGVYEFAHSFGSDNFNIQITKANTTGAANASGFTFEVLKRAAVFDIYVRDSSSDTLTDSDFNIVITHGMDSDYPLDIV